MYISVSIGVLDRLKDIGLVVHFISCAFQRHAFALIHEHEVEQIDKAVVLIGGVG